MALRLAAAAAALAAASAATDDGFVLTRFAADSPAKCLDGSPGGYYLRKGDPSKWMIELEGGGWCYDADQCLARSKTAIGSSVSWPATGCPSMDGGAAGMFSSNSTVNPRFYAWSKIHLNYCDGASFAGSVAQPVQVAGGATLYFRGREILDAAIDAALAAGMANASEVILKGCSAGGLAVYLHADYFAQRVKAANPRARVVAMPDAGAFLDHPNTAGQRVYTPEIMTTVALHQPLQPGCVNDACLAAHNATGDAWKCFMAQYTLPFITTPLYVTQDLDDTWQMANIFELPCQPWVAGSCNAQDLAWMAQYRAAMLAALAPVLTSPTNGAFLTTCVQHCHQNNDGCWAKSRVQNQSLADSFWSWYSGGGDGLQRIVVDGDFGTDTACFCTPYQGCHAPGGGCGAAAVA